MLTIMLFSYAMRAVYTESCRMFGARRCQPGRARGMGSVAALAVFTMSERRFRERREALPRDPHDELQEAEIERSRCAMPADISC